MSCIEDAIDKGKVDETVDMFCVTTRRALSEMEIKRDNGERMRYLVR